MGGDYKVSMLKFDYKILNKKFSCKELGFLKIRNAAGQSFCFDIGLRWGDLSQKIKDRAVMLKHTSTNYPSVCRPGSMSSLWRL